MLEITCCKCNQPPDHSIQIRRGDPSRDPESHAPDKSILEVVRLCDEHWEELRYFLGVL